MASSPSPESHPHLHSSPQQAGTPEDKDFPAPAGWQKKIASTKSGGTPRRGAVYFIAPDGAEIKSKRSLEGYLKSHPGGPSVTEFDWSTGETPRRSSRLSTKTPLDSPEDGSGRKRVRRKVNVEDESPQDKERAGLEEGAPSAKADEVMEDVKKVNECEAVEIVEPVEKMESDINEEVEKTAEKTDEHKIVERVSGGETEMAKTVERSDMENGEGKDADAVLPRENGPEEELVKQEEIGGEKFQTEEGKAEKMQNTMEETPVIEVSEVVLPRENEPEEEPVKQEEIRGEKFQIEEGKAEKLQNTMEETPVIEVSEVGQCGEEATSNGKIGTSEEEHKLEDSEKATNGVSQLSETPEASRPVGVND